MAKLKSEVLDQIRSDAQLFADVSKVMGIKPVSLPAMLTRNPDSLTEYSIVKVLSDYLKVSPEDLIEEDSEKEAKVA